MCKSSVCMHVFMYALDSHYSDTTDVLIQSNRGDQ